MLPLANKQHFSINQADLQPTYFHPHPYLGQSLEKQLYSAIWGGLKGYREWRSTAYWWHWSQNLPHFPLLLFMVIVLWCVQCFTGKTKDRILEGRKSGVFPHIEKAEAWWSLQIQHVQVICSLKYFGISVVGGNEYTDNSAHPPYQVSLSK